MADNNVLELEKTLQVDGQTYNINAVQADKVANKLFINKIKLGDKDKTTADTSVIEFDGSSQKTLGIVPADGGRFSGRITVPPVSDTTLRSDGETVLNYKDIVSKVVDRLLNTSAMATWNNDELTFTDTETPAVHGICVVLGTEPDAANFAESNNENWNLATSENPPSSVPKWLPNFLYICEDTGNIYLGKAESTETRLLSDITKEEIITPKSIEVAANQWITENSYGLDMANSDVINLNGLFFADYANLNNEGLNFVQKQPKEHEIDNSTIKDPDKAAEIIYDRVYARQGKFYFVPNCTIRDDQQRAPFEVYHSGTIIPITNGGTGADNSRKAEYNINSDMELFNSGDDIPDDYTQIVFKYKVPTAEKGALYTRHVTQLWTYIAKKIRTVFGFNDNNVLKVANGGTGQKNLNDVTVGKADKVKIRSGYYNSKTKKFSANTYHNDIVVGNMSPEEYETNITNLENGTVYIKYSY